MKILLDECVPVQVRNALVGHEVSTAQRMGWSGISNGELLNALNETASSFSSSRTRTFAINKT